MSDERPEETPPRTGAEETATKPEEGAPGAGGERPAPEAPAEPAARVATAKAAKVERDAGPSWIRSGGCLLTLLVLLVVLGVVALVYRPPQLPAAGPQELHDDAGDAGPADRPPIRAVALAPDASLVAFGGEESVDGRYLIRFVGLRERRFDPGAADRSIAAHTAPIRALRFRPDGTELFSGSLDGTVGWWKVADGSNLGTLEPPGSPDESRGILALAVSPDGRRLAAGNWAGDVFVWDLEAPGQAVTVFRGMHAPWESDPKELVPTGHLDEVRALAFVPGDPPLLISGGADGQFAAWDLAQTRSGRLAAGDGRTWKVKELVLRQIQFQRDRDFAIVSLLPSPERQGVLAGDYRGCAYLLATDGPCRAWWLGGPLANGPAACVRPLLDRKKLCIPFERAGGEGEASLLGLYPFPQVPGGYIGLGWNERFRLFRSADPAPWRTFEGAARRREWMLASDFNAGQRLAVTGGETGHLRLYEILGEATSPDVRLADEY